MGKKRKQEKSEEEIRRKIKKLTEKLARSTNNNVEAPLSPQDFNASPRHTPYIDSPYHESYPETFQYEESQYLATPSLPPSLYELPPGPALPLRRAGSPPPEPTEDVPQYSQPEPGSLPDKEITNLDDVELGEDILQLFGDAPKEDSSTGPPIHKDIARRWQDILAKGLSKEARETISKDYSVPSNCDLLIPPILNPEIKVALSEGLVKRDSSIMYRQRQLAVALSALAKLNEKIISNETSKQQLLKPLADACRILCHSHYFETKTRRDFVISSTNANLKDTLIDTTRDKFLFGENVSEKLKTAKSIQQSGNVLKPAPRRNVNPTHTNNKGRLNYVVQHRKFEHKINDTRKTAHQTRRQPSNSGARRPTELSTAVKSRPINRK